MKKYTQNKKTVVVQPMDDGRKHPQMEPTKPFPTNLSLASIVGKIDFILDIFIS